MLRFKFCKQCGFLFYKQPKLSAKQWGSKFLCCKKCSSKWTSKYKKKYTSHKLYDVWRSMKSRCYNPNTNIYNRYGGRGITVCNEWIGKPDNFIEWCLNNGYKSGLEVDRIDNNKGYSPNNCRITTRQINTRNRNKQKNTSSRYFGVSFSKNARKYESFLKTTEKKVHLGLFETEEEAALARDKYIIENKLGGFILNTVKDTTY